MWGKYNSISAKFKYRHTIIIINFSYVWGKNTIQIQQNSIDTIIIVKCLHIKLNKLKRDSEDRFV